MLNESQKKSQEDGENLNRPKTSNEIKAVIKSLSESNENGDTRIPESLRYYQGIFKREFIAISDYMKKKNHKDPK